jgi:DNA-binding NarL/FixJ family response regulator
VRLAGAAAALHGAGGSAIELIRHRGTEDRLEEARRAMGEAGAAAWAAGRTMPAEAAIAYALACHPAPSPSPRPCAGRAEGTGASSPREREVARLVAKGYSNRQIAETLVIGERTAEAHLSNVLSRLVLATRVPRGAWAVAHGLATSPDG